MPPVAVSYKVPTVVKAFAIGFNAMLSAVDNVLLSILELAIAFNCSSVFLSEKSSLFSSVFI